MLVQEQEGQPLLGRSFDLKDLYIKDQGLARQGVVEIQDYRLLFDFLVPRSPIQSDVIAIDRTRRRCVKHDHQDLHRIYNAWILSLSAPQSSRVQTRWLALATMPEPR